MWSERARWVDQAGWVGLPLLCLVFFGHGLGGDFHYDDEHSIWRNPHIRSLERLPAYFGLDGPDYFSADADKRMYRPLLLSSYALNHALGGYRPGGWLAVNLALHMLCSVLVWRLVRRLGGDGAAALFAGALFAVHPLASEPVNYISSRSESLAAGLLLGALLCHLGDPRRPGLAALLFGLALLTKSVALMGMGLFWGIDRWILHRSTDWRRYLPYAGLAAAYMAVLVASRFLGGSLQNPVRPLAAQAWTQIKAVPYYLHLLFVPEGLNVEHQFWVSDGPTWAGLAGGALAASALWWAWRGRRRWGGAALWSALVLLPTAVVPLNMLVNERRLYLVLVALAWVGALAYRQAGRPALRKLLWACIPLLGLLSWQRTAVWADDLRLWEDAVAKAPHMYRAQVNLGKARQVRGDLAQAEAVYRRALQLGGPQPDVCNNLATLLHEQGRVAEAAQWYERALQQDPKAAAIWQNLATARLALEDLAGAVAAYEAAVTLRPDDGAIWNNYGQALSAVGQWAQAEAALRRAIQNMPEEAEPYNNLANVLSSQGQNAEAEKLYRAALALKPRQAGEIWANLADLLLATDRPAQGLEAAEQALSLGADARYWRLKGQALEALKRRHEAIAAYRQSLALDAQVKRTRAELGELYQRLGRWAEAKEQFDAALRLDPTYSRAWYGLAETAWANGQRAEAAVAYRRFLAVWQQADGRRQRARQRLAAAEAGP